MADSKEHLTNYSFFSSTNGFQPSLSQNQRSLRYSIKVSIILLSSITRSELAVWKSASSWHVLRKVTIRDMFSTRTILDMTTFHKNIRGE